jgi:hypothetical protein
MAKKDKKRGKAPKPANDEPLVNGFTAQHGEYREATVVDLGNELGGGRQKTYRVIRNLYPTVVDRWLAGGGPGFEEPQRRAIDHCRSLWHRLGSQGKLVANLSWTGGGGGGPERGVEQAEALAQLGTYSSRIPPIYWLVFENVVRNDMAAGAAGNTFGVHPSQQAAHAKNCVGFVASMIAQWRGF